ncbi:MAG TPA: sigma 54-interacting transcriptional regulator [Kofleriaceae bacterium]|nr:sigma 54-interacting transcriptional regulator [Kofleriaceae bacterium]
MGLTFDTLAEVALARDMLRRWYGLELGLAAPDGTGYDRTSHETCETVRKHPDGGCAAAMKEAAATLAGRKGAAAVVQRCHAGLTLVAAPVRSTSGLSGIVYTSGARTDDEPAAVIGKLLSLGGAESTAAVERAPMLSDADVAHVKDLVEAAAQAVERALPTVIPPTTFTHPFTEIVGDAPAVREVVKLLTKVVKSEATVLIHGESGTGKELIARAIHYHGPRAKKTFVVQNCSAFNDNLLESALFGHVRGAFTGAVKDQKGLFEVADGGTFFLDEIGDMSAALQVKLLRVLQEGTFMPVGGTKPVKVDVRIIAASHKDLQSMVAHKQFREDLFYRVNVLKITVPPLRERVADIPRLAAHFVQKHWKFPTPAPRLSQSALARLVAYAWPGNIRELENEIERMLVLAADASELTASMVSTRLGGQAVGMPRALRDSLAVAEAGAITETLGRHSGDRDAAASDLNVSRAYLDARIAALGL